MYNNTGMYTVAYEHAVFKRHLKGIDRVKSRCRGQARHRYIVFFVWDMKGKSVSGSLELCQEYAGDWRPQAVLWAKVEQTTLFARLCVGMSC